MQSPSSLHRPVSPSLILLSSLIFLLAFLPRLGAIDRYVTPDELLWVDRSIHFSTAIAQHAWAATAQTGHPGVITMWLGSAGLAAQRMIDPAGQGPGASLEFDPQNAVAVRRLARFLTAARLPVILVVSFNVALLFLLLVRRIDQRAAFLATGLIALDPFAVALGSLIHIDALMVTFSLLSVAALSIAIEHPQPTRWLIFSGALAGLAALSKSPAVMLGPLALLSLVLTDPHHRSIRYSLVGMLIWSAGAAIFCLGLYPALWVAPLDTFRQISDMAKKYSETAHAVNYFFGSNAGDPGPAFYPIVIAFRSTPVLWAGLIAVVPLIFRARTNIEKSLRSNALLYFLFAILFIGLITSGAKKLDRYAFPALLALDIVGAMGLAYAIELIANQLKNRSKVAASIAIAACLFITSIQFLGVWPLTLRSYNPLLGGYNAANRALPVGGGESAEVGRVLAASPFATKVIAVSDIIGTAPFFAGDLVPNDKAGFARADYLLFNASDFQLTPDVPQHWIDAAPVMTISVQHQNFAWLYPNQRLAADRQRLIDQRQAGDAVITDYAAALPNDLSDPTFVLPADISEAVAIDELTRVAQTHARIFFFHYTASREPASILITRLLDTFAIKLDEWSSPLSSGALYILPKGVSFNATPTPLYANATFGQRAHLTEAALIAPHVQPGQAIGLATAWIAALPETQLFVSLVDAGGHAWSQIDDRVPASDNGNTQRAKRLTVPVPPVTPPGVYQLKLSAIDLESGAQLSIQTADNNFAGFDWPLGSITIDPAQTQIDPATRKPAIEIDADLGGLRAIGSDMPPEPIAGGDPWTLAVEWVSSAEHLSELDIEWLLASNDQIVYSTTLPLNSYSTDHWRKSDVLQSKYDFRLPIAIPAGRYELKFRLIDHATHQPLSDQATLLTSVNLISRPRGFTAPAVQYPSNIQFGSIATLLGANRLQSDQALTVTLIWQANQVTTTNTTAFVQVIHNDQVVKQIDNWQIGGDAPTSIWAPGQIIVDQYVFDVSSGDYLIAVGLYDAANGQRLTAIDSTGKRLPQDRAVVIQ